MNPPSTPEDRLSPADLAFLVQILNRERNDQALYSLLVDDECLVNVLDLPVVFQALIESPSIVEISPRLYFYVVVRHVFRRAGLDDVAVTRYVAKVLTGNVNRRAGEGRGASSPQYAIDFIERIGASRGAARFEWWIAAGDHFLVLTGLYADFLRRRTEDRGAPSLEFYEDFGRQAYRAAGDHPRARQWHLTDTLHRLADAFPDTRKALNCIAEDYLCLAN
jgi:hypothetical protein